MSKLIVILTDFGLIDTYVGVMKGVIKTIYPDAECIDLTHAIPPQSIQNGALALLHSYKYFPIGTTFLVIVDPGVGSSRNPIVVEANGYTFVAPDNGVLSYVLDQIGNWKAVALTNPKFHLDNVSYSFHGRDIFAPASAYIASKTYPLEAFGEPVETLVILGKPHLVVETPYIEGEIVHIDHFGNIITSIGPISWNNADELLLNDLIINPHQVRVKIGEHIIDGIVQSYYEVGVSDLLAKVDSNGYLEVSINQGNAQNFIQCKHHDHVTLVLH